MKAMARDKRPSLIKVLRQANSRRRTQDEAGTEIRIALAMLLVVAGLVLGGGGSSNPATEVLLQFMAAAMLLIWAFVPGHPARIPSAAFAVLVALVLAVPLLQLVPLPPSIWHTLPGREVELAALSLVGREQAWMPWSIAPAHTLAVLLAMVPALVLAGFVASLDHAGRTLVIRTIVVMAVVSVLLGTLQLAAPPGKTPTFYSYVHEGFVIGFQANKNAEVDVLLIGLLATAASYAVQSGRASGVGFTSHAVIALILLLGAVLTGSRAGILLIPATMVLALLTVQRGSLFARRTLIAVLSTALVLLGAAWLLRDNAMLARVAARFSADTDFRAELWTDTVYAIGQYWPVGGGMGTFVQLMTPAERLEVLDVTTPSRAHNDFLELVLEAGVVGPIALALIVALLVWMGWRSTRTGAVLPAHRLFAFAAFFIIAAHSLVDYPLRSMSLAMVLGVAAGLLVPPRNPPPARAADAT